MSAAQVVANREFSQLSNNLLSELKTSYPIWEDLISKSGKFHSSLKLTIQSAAVFLDAVQRVADLATRTYGGSREIGACLTRLCLRQKRLETKLKTMNNHLVTSLANPLAGKLEEWRRTLSQLEKDRTRQTKRARAELKRALSEASRWQKKAAKCGTTSTDLGPGVGHGILPNSAAAGSKASVVAAQAASAAREVQNKTEEVETAEKSAVRSLMLEERGRFCFFLSCLLPVLECQSSMLGEIAAIDELIQSLSKAANNPDQLMEDAESILFQAARGDLSNMSRSSFYMSEHENSSGLIAAATAALFANSGHNGSGLNAQNNGSEQNQTGSSDTDSGRLTMEAVAPEVRRDGPSDNCSLASSTQLNLEMGIGQGTRANNAHHHVDHIPARCHSICDPASLSIGGVSSHSSSGGSNTGYGYFNPSTANVASPGPFPSRQYHPSPGSEHVGSGLQGNRKSSLTSVHSTASMCVESNNVLSVMASRMMSNRNCQQVDSEETQFQTLCRPGHNRTASVGGGTAMLAGSDVDMRTGFVAQKQGSDSVSEANLSLNQYSMSATHPRPVVDPEWLRVCDQANDEDEEEEDEEDDDEDDDGEEDADERSDSADGTNGQSSTLINTGEEDGGEYVQVTDEVHNNPSPKLPPAVSGVGQAKTADDALLGKDSGGLNSGRHTISSAYERGGIAGNRVPIGALSFNPPIGKSSSKDSGVDSSTVLYPNQALPPPVYTNLTQLAHAAQRKFSISNLPNSVQNSDVSDKLSETGGLLGSPSRRMQSIDPEPGYNQNPSTITRARDLISSCSTAAPQQQQQLQPTSSRHSVSDLAAAVRSAPQTPLSSSLSTGAGVPVDQINRRGTLPASSSVARSGSNGIDPFSVEMDELDRMVAGSYASMPRLRFARNDSFTLCDSPAFASVSTAINFRAPTGAPAPVDDRSNTPLPTGAPPDSPYMRSLNPTLLTRTFSRPGMRHSRGSPLPSPVAFPMPHSISQSTLVSLFHGMGSTEPSNDTCPRSPTWEQDHGTPPPYPERSNTVPPGVWNIGRPEENTSLPSPVIPPTEAQPKRISSWTRGDASRPPPISPKPPQLKQSIASRNRRSLGSSARLSRTPPPPPTRRSSFLACSASYDAQLDNPPTPNQPGPLDLSNGFANCMSLPSSSCASSLTIASSATSESQPSINGAARAVRRTTPGLQTQDTHDTGETRPTGPSNMDTGPWMQSGLAAHGQHRPDAEAYPAAYGKHAPNANTANDLIAHGSPYLHRPPNESNISVKPVSSEAAHLMSQLSTQLQQLAIRSNDMTLSSGVVGGRGSGANSMNTPYPTASGDGFDLPPPPPDSMFTGTEVSNTGAQPAAPTGQDALLTALKRSIERRAAKVNTHDHSGPSRPG